VVEKFKGEAFILDSSRAHVDEVRVGGPMACDGWISVNEGWVELRHRSGHVLRVGSGSFAQIHSEADDMTLLRGYLHAQAFADSKLLSILTPNARAQLKVGSALLIYQPEKQSSQWVVLDRMGLFENRFEHDTQVTVRGGESSILDLSQPRVVPQAAKAITIATLKPFLKSLALEEKKSKKAVVIALERQRRIFPASFDAPSVDDSVGGVRFRDRSPASLEGGVEKTDYGRTEKLSEDLEKGFRTKIVGTAGHANPESLLLEPAVSGKTEAEALEKRLTRKAAADEKRRREALLKDLERIPASE
jgi:hypothetical protein